MIRKAIILFTLIVSSSVCAKVTKLVATVDKNPIMLDEAITLTVIATGEAQSDDLDTKALLKDFVVGRTSVSSQTKMINFNTTRTTQWTTSLFPPETGTFTIPAFTIDGVSSEPIRVKVIDVPKNAKANTRDYYVTTEVSSTEVYLQQQIHYTVKLYLANAIERGGLQSPALENGIIQQVGEDKQYSDIVNGKRYSIIERTFAIIPQQSGELTIKGPIFSGEVLAANTNQRFGYFNRTKPIKRIGPDIKIDVKPMPKDVTYPWLPSEFVQLDEEWPKNLTFTVGEPVTRTLTLSVSGLTEEQLPEIQQSYPPDFKQYPDQSKTASASKDGILIAQRVESVAIIPTRAGHFVLPEVSVPWFNVSTGKTEYAVLPPKAIEVMPAVVEDTVVNNEEATQETTSPPVNTESNMDNSPQDLPNDQHIINSWIMALLWLVTLCGWSATVIYYRKRYVLHPDLQQQYLTYPISSSESDAFKALEKAVNKGQINEIVKALTIWLQTGAVPSVTNLPQLGQQPHTQQLKTLVDGMLANKYSSNGANWDKQALLSTIKELRKFSVKNKKKNLELTPLYPNNNQ